jgi:hypothetical protein
MAFENFWMSETAAPPTGASLRFSGAQKASRPPTATGNRKTWTWSGWVKRGQLGTAQGIFSGVSTVNDNTKLFFGPTNNLEAYNVRSSSTANGFSFLTNAIFRDPGAWYHICWAVDVTQATISNGVKIYVNGVLQTPSSTAYVQNADTYINVPGAVNELSSTDDPFYLNGYQSDAFLVDGLQLPPTTFGQFDSNGVWVPLEFTTAKANVITAGGFGTNGFALRFESQYFNSGTLVWADQSGNGNDFTANWNCAAGSGTSFGVPVGTDIVDDGPNVNNAHLYNVTTGGISVLPRSGTLYPWFWPYDSQVWNNQLPENVTIPTSGKWWLEYIGFTGGSIPANSITGFMPVSAARTTSINIGPGFSVGYGWYNPTQSGTSEWRDNGVFSNIGASLPYAVGVVQTIKLGFAIDCDQATPQVQLWQNAVNSPTDSGGWQLMGTKTLSRSDVNSGLVPSWSPYYMNQGPSALYTNTTAEAAGYKQLFAANLPAATIPNGETGFQAILDTGANILTAAQAAFPNGLWWVKDRVNANQHQLMDSVRGGSLALRCPNQGPETAYSAPTGNSVAWCWATDASGLNTSTGFQIVTYTGNGVAGRTLSHSLGAVPDMMLVRWRSGGGLVTNDWNLYHSSIGPTGRLVMGNSQAVQTTVNPWNNTAPTSSVFTVGLGTDVNNLGTTYVAYLWTPISGYSSFGSYTGNGSADGPFVYTGFKPAFVLFKCSSSAGTDWMQFDSTRNPYNVTDLRLSANQTTQEVSNSSYYFDMVSNGFKLRGTSLNFNTSGATYIYAAFAEKPFGGSNVAPVTAR